MSNTSNPLWPVIGTLLGVLVGTASTAATAYWITYQGVEKQKLELESKKADLELRKASIEIHKQALALTPNVALSCDGSAVDRWTWKVMCTAKNLGTYHADVAISDAKVSLSSDIKDVLYEAGNGFTVEFPNKRQGFRATPGVTGQLWFHIAFNRARYKNGIRRPDLVARVYFSFQTIPSASTYFVGRFPELEAVISDIAHSGYTAWVELPALPDA